MIDWTLDTKTVAMRTSLFAEPGRSHVIEFKIKPYSSALTHYKSEAALTEALLDFGHGCQDGKIKMEPVE